MRQHAVSEFCSGCFAYLEFPPLPEDGEPSRLASAQHDKLSPTTAGQESPIGAPEPSAGPTVAQVRSVASHPAALIDLNALTVDTDFTVFMRKDLPEDVHRAALRRLWVLMQFPVSCHDLCYEPEPAASGFARLTSEKLPVTAH